MCIAAAELPAEHFRNIVDAAIVVQVAHEEAVIATDPAGAFRKAVEVEVEIDLACRHRPRFDPVAVKIDDQGVIALGPAQTLGKAHGGPREPCCAVQGVEIAVDGDKRADPGGQRLDDNIRGSENAHDDTDHAGESEFHAQHVGLVLKAFFQRDQSRDFALYPRLQREWDQSEEIR